VHRAPTGRKRANNAMAIHGQTTRCALAIASGVRLTVTANPQAPEARFQG